MIGIKTNIPKELSDINDKLKAIYHSKIQFVFLFLKIENSVMSV